MPGFETYLINLDGSADRLAHARTALAAQGIEDFHRIAAVDGRGERADAFAEYSAAAANRYMGRGLLGAEVACVLSHTKALRAFVANGADYALILEDDVDMTDGAIASVHDLIAWQEGRDEADWHIAQLGNPYYKLTSPAGHTGSQEVLRSHYFAMLATALLWTRDGAIQFLDGMDCICCPYDTELRRQMIPSGMGIVVREPRFFPSGAESEIHNVRARNRHERHFFYPYVKQRRLLADKVTAGLHMLKYRTKQG